jgi:tRNA pseudouridine65 synthase
MEEPYADRDEWEAFPEPLEIVYQDAHLIAVNKPAGLLVHRAPQTPRDQPVLLQKLRDQIGQMLYPAHRLDRPTSGLILFGLSSAAAAGLVRQFTKRQVKKGYDAFVRGYMPAELCIDIPLRERFGEDEPGFDPACHPTQPAQTWVRSKQWYELPWPMGKHATSRYALVEASPMTGRWHQIRRHLKHVSHPIIGDYRHGDSPHNQLFVEKFGVTRMLLAACRLELLHPIDGHPMKLATTRGAIFEELLTQLVPFEVPFDPQQLPAEQTVI